MNFVEELLSKMTLEEKIGQMNQYNGFYDVTGPAPDEGDAKKKYEHIKKGWVGSMLNVKGVAEVHAMQRLAVENSRLGIPLIFGFDVIHGYRTTAPIPLAEVASWDLEAIEQSAQIAAKEAAAAGLNWTFAPMVDVGRDPRWGRVMEGAGEDPYLGSLVAKARVRGFQGDDLSSPHTIAACAKHFAGYAFSEAGRDYNIVDVGGYTLYNVIMPPFKAAVEAGVQTFMNGFNDLNGVPVTGSAYLQRDILKGKWGFEGFVVSDWGSISEMQVHGYAEDGAAAARLAANAGSDMDMESYLYVNQLKALVESGEVPMEYIDDAARRILTVKYKLGLFDDPYKYCDEEREKKWLGHQSHKDAALDLAKKSIVLLKNENKLLPLPKTGKKIALIGHLAKDKNSPLGNWRFASEDNSAVSVLEGLQDYGNNSIEYEQGVQLFSGTEQFAVELTVNETDRTGMDAAVAAAKDADVVVMVLGEHGLHSGEARSRAHIGLPGLQQELLEKVYAANPNIVLVLMNGRPLAISWAAEHIPAIVEAWQLGEQSGNAIAQVLYGDYNPSGKLPMTFPRTEGQIPIYYNYKNTGRPAPKGNDVFYVHYMDIENTPLYPFGYGLSYTTFEYKNLIAKQEGENIQVHIEVTNTGDRAGEEVVQLYIRDHYASNTRPIRELKGFEKIMLQPGETRTVSFDLTPAELGFYTNQGKFVVEAGDFDIFISDLKTTVDYRK